MLLVKREGHEEHEERDEDAVDEPRKGWRTGFLRGMEHGRRLWGVDDELKSLLESLPVQDQRAAMLAGSIAMRSHALASMSGNTARGELRRLDG